MIDLLVAGGGPAGLVTALHARKAGLEVTVVEPRSAPIDKACGEGLTPAAVAALGALGVGLSGVPLRGITYCDSRRRVDGDYAEGCGLGVRRTALHGALHAAAVEAGVQIVPGRVADVRADPSGVRAAGLHARYLVGADGLHSTVRRIVDPSPPATPLRRWGVRAHYRVAPWSDRVEVYWTGDAEVYVTPVADDLVGVAVLSTAPGAWLGRVVSVPELAARLPAEPVTRPLGAGPLRQPVRRRTRDRVLLVGDAAGYIDALTGDGLSLAFAEAAAAVARVAADDVAGYERDYQRITRAYRWVTAGLVAAATRRPLRRAIVPVACLVPGTFARAVRIVGE